MHPLVALVIGPLLAASGLASPGVVLEDPGLGEEAQQDASIEVEASASATEDSSAKAGVSLDAGTDGASTSALLGTSLPSQEAPLSLPDADQEEEASVAAPSVDEEDPKASDSETTPVPLPEPETAAVPAGLAVLGAAAYAVFRWRTLVPGLLPLYSRLQKDQLLENTTRARLVEVIEEEPGLSKKELCEAVDAGWGNTTYHLQRLEQAGFVRSQKQGHHRRFYRTGEMDGDEIEALGVLKNENAQQIARYLIQEPGSKQKDVCEALDISPSLAHKWIKRLEENELVESRREWRSKHYTPDDRLNRLVEAV